MSEREPIKVLLVEDEEITRDWMRRLVSRAGHRPLAVADATSARLACEDFCPHVALIDLLLPDADDFLLTRTLAQQSGCGVIIVSSVGDRERRLDGLRAGADDFLVKPCDPDEILLKVERLAGRLCSRPPRRTEKRPDTYRCGPWQNCPALLLCIHDNGREISLTEKEARLLSRLLDHPGRIFSRDELLQCLQDGGECLSPRAVDSCMSRLRKKLERNSARPLWLQIRIRRWLPAQYPVIAGR